MVDESTTDVVIYGGGIGGATLAKQLAPYVRVTLVDPLDYFEVPMAVPRNLVKPTFAESSIVPFATALPTVRLIKGRLVELTAEGGLVEDANGGRSLVTGKVSVLATGSRFANDLMRAVDGTASERHAFYGRFNDRLVAAQRVLIVGGGPIGVEVAGELSQTWPDKKITMIEAGPRLLSGTSETAAQHAASVLASRGVTIIVDDKIEDDSKRPSDSVFADRGEAVTGRGKRIPYDLLLWCIGGRPNTAYMQQNFTESVNEARRIRVMPDLRVAGYDGLFAMGDITDLAENKMAAHIGGQVKVMAANARAYLNDPAAKLKVYTAKTGNPLMAVTLGSREGVTHLPLFGVIRSSWANRKVKAEHMLVPRYRKILGLS